MPFDDEIEGTVTMEELADVLSDTQKDELRALLVNLSGNPFSQEGMLAQYIISKTFVHQSVE